MTTSPPPFLVLALPRSRTAWLSKFLSYGPWICGHDQIRYFRTLDDIKSWLSQPFIGSAETLAPPYWRLIERFMPGGRVLVVRRPISEVIESILKIGIIGIDRPRLIHNLRMIDMKLDQAERRLSNCISVNFDELADPGICRIVFEHCLGVQFNLEWWKYWDRINVQVSLDATARYMWAHMVPMMHLHSLAQQQMKMDLAMQTRQTAGVK